MGSDKYFFLLLPFLFSNVLCHHDTVSKNATVKDAEKQALELVPSGDIFSALRDAKKFKNGFGEEWIAFPDENGPFIEKRMDINLNGIGIPLSWTSDEASGFQHLHLYLFTPENPEGTVIHLTKLLHSGIDPEKPFKIICHGWMANTNASIVQEIEKAYLKKNKYNVIGVNWEIFAKNIYYPLAAKLTRLVGKFVGFAINTMVKVLKVQYEDFHIIGHSLGAHVAGFAGNTVKSKVARITGLDPALPGFQFVKGRDRRLDSSDAHFVDVIHSCAGVLGMTIPVGHIDFYPNGGTPFQPGCQKSLSPLRTQACSHFRSYDYFVESINNPHGFEAIRCTDWIQFKTSFCRKEYAVMGDAVSKQSHGIFYLMTNKFPPFAKGAEGLKP